MQFLKKLSKLLYSEPTHLLNILLEYYFLIIIISFLSGATTYMPKSSAYCLQAQAAPVRSDIQRKVIIDPSSCLPPLPSRQHWLQLNGFTACQWGMRPFRIGGVLLGRESTRVETANVRIQLSSWQEPHNKRQQCLQGAQSEVGYKTESAVADIWQSRSLFTSWDWSDRRHWLVRCGASKTPGHACERDLPLLLGMVV